MENNWKNKNFFIALKNALNGIKYVFVNERNLKIQFIISIIVILISAFFKISFIEWAIIIITIFIVFLSELFNTAIEKVVDMITLEYNENAKIAKDIAAGGVTTTAIVSVIVGIIIFLPKILQIIM